eukprot:6203868-Pleurochrysis_carterae.AAC.5
MLDPTRPNSGVPVTRAGVLVSFLVARAGADRALVRSAVVRAVAFARCTFTTVCTASLCTMRMIAILLDEQKHLL